MAFTRISNSQINSRGATTLPNQPQISAAALKEEFDAPAKQIVAPAVNNLMDELETSTSAGNLGAVAPTGRTGSTVQSVLNSLSTDLGTAEAQSHAHPNKAVIDKFADDGTGLTYDGNPVGAVTSVNSQTGAVVLTASDVGALPSTTAIPTKTSDLTNDSGFITSSSLPTRTSQLTNDSGFITSGDIPAIPTKTSDLTNDSNFVADASYVHTDNNYDATAKAIVDGATAAIAAKSTVAWNQIDTTGTKIAEITIDGVKTEVKATGGGSADAYKTIDAGGQSFVASGADTFKINAGSNVTITPLTGDKGIQISAAGGGTSTGDMLASVYDNDFTIKNASPTGNGIKDYVASAISGKVDTAGDGLAKEGTTIALDLGMLTGSNLTKAVSGKDIKDALDEKADTSDIPTPAEKATWDAKVSESLLKSTVGWTGKNEFPIIITSVKENNVVGSWSANAYTRDGITYTLSEDGKGNITEIDVDGTSTAKTSFILVPFKQYSGKKIMSGCNGGSSTTYELLMMSSTTGDLHCYDGDAAISLRSDINYQVRISVKAGAVLSHKKFYPMLRDASITDDTYKPYHESVEEEIEQIHADNGVLGAKNLLPNNATSQTINGVTLTVNADGSITANGTATQDVIFIIRQNTTEYNDKDLILSGCPSGGSQNTYDLYVRVANSSDQYITNIHDTGSGAQLTPEAGLTGTNLIRVQIIIKSGYTANNLIFHPMIRLASDPDDTYVPYAMTNRELTEKVFEKRVLTSADDLNNITKTGIYHVAVGVGNVPESRTNLLLIVDGFDSTQIRQTLTTKENIYTRSKEGTTWSSWTKFTGTIVS